MSYHLSLQHLSKSFGNVPAVKDVSLEIKRGELVTLLGPSGCGKTTTLQMLAGFVQPDGGAIFLGGRDITHLPPYRRNTPLVFQEYALFPHLSVFENIAYGLKLQKKDRHTIRQKVETILDDLNLPQTGKRFPSQLSGGQQQRIALARALVLDPEVLLLDEPLSNLDAKLRVKVRYEIKELRERFHMTIIFVTHDQEEALSISDKIAVMNQGVVEQFGDPTEIYYRPQNEFVAGFIGETNFLEVNIAACVQKDQKAQVRFEWRDHIFHAACLTNGIKQGERRKLLLRPETISLYRPDQIRQKDQLIPGRIKQNSFLGAMMRYWVDIGGQEVIVDDAKMVQHGLFEGEILMAFQDHPLHFV